MLARYAVGGFASGAMKAKWDPGEENACPLCGDTDSKVHRLLQCPATEHIRMHWRPLIEPILRTRPSWTHACFATLPPDLDIANLMFATRKFALGSARLLPSLVQDLARLRFYTDGSCKFPDLPFARHAGFGVVLDTMPGLPACAVESCLAQVKLDPSVIPFVPVATHGFVPDEQNINRAELCALIRAAEMAAPYRHLEIEFCTDSAFAISEIGTILSGGDGLYPDLTPLLRDVWHDSFTLRKVKAHADVSCLRGSELWDAAGNEMADRVAKLAVSGDFEVLGQTLSDIAQFCYQQSDELLVFSKFLLDMSYEENRLKKLSRSGTSTQVQIVEDTAAAHRAAGVDIWLGRVPDGMGFSTSLELATDWALACTWPPWYTYPLWVWLNRLRWPIAADDRQASEGCTHLELLVDFIGSTGVCPPLAITDSGGGHILVDPTTIRGSLMPGTLRLWTQHLLDAARQLQTLSGRRLLPDKRHKVFSLIPLGRSDPQRGVRVKPMWRDPQRLVNDLTEVLSSGSSESLVLLARRYEGPVFLPGAQLVEAWSKMPKLHREQLARWCRRR